MRIDKDYRFDTDDGEASLSDPRARSRVELPSRRRPFAEQIGTTVSDGLDNVRPAPFEPATLGPVTLRNRVIKAATFEGVMPRGRSPTS